MPVTDSKRHQYNNPGIITTGSKAEDVVQHQVEAKLARGTSKYFVVYEFKLN
jgi:hypothetical protein